MLSKLTLSQPKKRNTFSKVLTLTFRSFREFYVLTFGFFLVGVLTIEPKTLNHDFEESLPGLMTTLFPTVHILFIKIILK
jgi:hypothetical protein